MLKRRNKINHMTMNNPFPKIDFSSKNDVDFVVKRLVDFVQKIAIIKTTPDNKAQVDKALEVAKTVCLFPFCWITHG